jgi:hypothetical protein
MAAKIPKWENELWSYVSSGDGEHCPLHSLCQTKLACGWCPDENKKRLNQFLDQDEVTLQSCDFMETNIGGQTSRLFLLAELMAQKYLKMGGVDCPPVPTGIVSLADKQRCIEIHALPLKAYHGAIWRLNEEWVIQLRDGDTSARKRFALFHETFHILS